MIKIDAVEKIISAMDEIKFAYLFGSYAKNRQSEKSDIDIAVYLEEKHHTFDTKLKIHHALEITLKKEIDLVVLNSAKNFDLLTDIFHEDIVLKDSKDDARIMYELQKEHEILDYKAFKRMLDVA